MTSSLSPLHERRRGAPILVGPTLYHVSLSTPGLALTFNRALLTATDERAALELIRTTFGDAPIVQLLDFGQAARDVPNGVVLWSQTGGIQS